MSSRACVMCGEPHPVFECALLIPIGQAEGYAIQALRDGGCEHFAATLWQMVRGLREAPLLPVDGLWLGLALPRLLATHAPRLLREGELLPEEQHALEGLELLRRKCHELAFRGGAPPAGVILVEGFRPIVAGKP